MATEIKSGTEYQAASVAVLNFWASWAEPCAHLNEVFDELARKYPSLSFFKVEAESFPEVSEQFEIVAVPTFVFLQKGKATDRVDGANASELTKKVAKLAQAVPAPAQQAAPQPPKDLNTRLKELINLGPCVAFIKGTPLEPRCGFSRQLIEIFEKNKVAYTTFNILTDEDVRQGLKTFSNWPTYPQVYVKGELVGGLDIIKELEETGELKTTLPIKESDDLNTRLKNLINKAPVMLFMKGVPAEPRCGFSQKIVNLLNQEKVEFDSFDILSDEDVRQGLKAYSNWPTYPQLYVRGELVGGLDIAQELAASGELKSLVAGN